ncbi:TrkA family potassium uptake protein [uncultured Gemmiger sp.]|uniref:potassium channel family protein n=1 Tax=uncultured Gemmiger sp. TaxID=1623490 RepID=UPI0025D9BF68|nr:TrkA family potassium uptake protein [uncultured Gemmiger sp.]
MFHKHKKEKLSYGIVGLGRFGYALAVDLAQSGAEILVIDRDEEKVRELREYTENALVVNTLDKKSLMDTGIQNCDVAVVCIGENMESSILTTLNLVSLGVPQVIAKATSAEHGEILAKLGAEVVYPERDMALRLANRLETARVLDFIQLSESINISKRMVPEKFIGKTVLEMNIRAQFGLNIIAVENGGEVVDTVGPDYTFRAGDIMIVSGSRDDLLRLSEWEEKDD